MGSWGVRSDENDRAADALDAGFERVHGPKYDDLMEDGNPLTVDQIQRQLANPATLLAALESLREDVGAVEDEYDDEDRLGYVGVVVRHVELGVAIPPEVRDRALAWLRDEAIEWEEATVRRLRKAKEVDLLGRASVDAGPRI